MIKPLQISPEELKLFTLKNSENTTVQILNLGASVFNLFVKDNTGNLRNVVVGPKNIETYLRPEYLHENRCFGSSVGRFAGRISNGRFNLDGETYKLHEKDGAHLHGGFRGLQHKIWNLESWDKENNSVRLSCFSPDGEEGYPGNLNVLVTYTLTEENALEIEYSALSDKTTIINMTNHTYFNLDGGGSVSGHHLNINASNILEVDEKIRPSGKFVFLKGHSKNFSVPKKIGNGEVDDTFILENSGEYAVELYSENSGINLQVETNQPSVVVYIPEELPEKWEYKNELERFPSICMETQIFPDAPNFEHFPSAVINSGEEYLNFSSFKFSLKEK